MTKVLYIVNPTSGKGRGQKVISKISQYSDKNNYKIITTQYPLHATEIASNELRNYNIIVSVGGDGTLNEVINGIKINSEVKLGVLPIGSGNDFVKNIGGDYSIKETLSTFYDSKKRTVISADLGNISYLHDGDDSVNEHLFINNLGIGFDAYVGYINQNNKVFSGLTSYIYAVIKALFNYKMVDLELSSKLSHISGKRLMISIGNGKSSGGGFYLNPNADISDGLLDLSVFDEITRRRLLTALPMALLNKIEQVPEAKLETTSSIELKLKNPYYAHCDGEIISDKLKSAKISIHKSAIKVIKKLGD